MHTRREYTWEKEIKIRWVFFVCLILKDFICVHYIYTVSLTPFFHFFPHPLLSLKFILFSLLLLYIYEQTNIYKCNPLSPFSVAQVHMILGMVILCW